MSGKNGEFNDVPSGPGNRQRLRFETLQLHVGQEEPDPVTDARAVPIYLTASYVFKSCDHAARRFTLEDPGNIYGRLTNTTQEVFERRMAALEGGTAALAVSSGAAAITYVVQNLAGTGDHVVSSNAIYGGTYNCFAHTFVRHGITTTFVDPDDYEGFERAIRPNTKCLFVETIGNPNAQISDVERMADIAHRHGIPLVVDNTFATPYHQKPLEHGADLVVHSATKALGGHNDIMAGAIAGLKRYYNELWFTRQAIGTTLDAYSAFLLDRGLKTFEVRAAAMARGAQVIAEHLQHSPKISRLFYPGLPSHPEHGIARKQMQHGFGGMLSFDVGQHQEDARRFINGLRTIYHAVSLGATESLICIPYLTTMLYLPPEKRTTFGVRENTVRLSVGIESPDRLVEDIDQALASV